MSERAIRFISDHQYLNLDKFPNTPKVGMPAFVNNQFYIYGQVGTLLVWVPMTSGALTYIHSQGLSSLSWVINHKLGTSDLIVSVYDNTGNVIYPEITHAQDVNGDWVTTVTFLTETLGYAVIFGSKCIDASVVNADVINATTTITVNGAVVITTSEQVKQLYESNLDTNPLTDELLTAIINMLTAPTVRSLLFDRSVF